MHTHTDHKIQFMDRQLPANDQCVNADTGL